MQIIIGLRRQRKPLGGEEIAPQGGTDVSTSSSTHLFLKTIFGLRFSASEFEVLFNRNVCKSERDTRGPPIDGFAFSLW